MAMAIAMTSKPISELFFITAFACIIQDYKNKKRMLNNDYYKSLILFRTILNCGMRNVECGIKSQNKKLTCGYR